MRPFYQEPGVTIYCGDSRDILPEIGTAADIIITSPPYNVGIKYAGEFDDKRPIVEFQHWTHEWLMGVFYATAEQSRSYFFVGDKMAWWFKPMAEEVGFTYHQKLSWIKTNLAGAGNKISGDWNATTEDILLFRKGKRTPMLRGESDMHTFNWFAYPSCQTNYSGNLKRVHPAQFPVEVIHRIIVRTPGGVILDPFMGSGTCGIAARMMGREFIGIEINETYCELAVSRIKRATKAVQNKIPELVESLDGQPGLFEVKG